MKHFAWTLVDMAAANLAPLDILQLLFNYPENMSRCPNVGLQFCMCLTRCKAKAVFFS